MVENAFQKWTSIAKTIEVRPTIAIVISILVINVFLKSNSCRNHYSNNDNSYIVLNPEIRGKTQSINQSINQPINH